MKDFNIAKYLKEHNLGSHGILGKYVDLQALKEEDQYGNNEPTQEVPYTGAEDKLDGFGDKFDQVKPVSELEKPEKIYSDDWMNDSVDGKKVGKWTCYYEDHMGVLYWINDDILSEDVVVYATPNWDGAKGIAIEIKGGMFALNIKQQLLNEQGEINAVSEMVGLLHEAMQILNVQVNRMITQNADLLRSLNRGFGACEDLRRSLRLRFVPDL